MLHLMITVGTSIITNIYNWLNQEKKVLRKFPLFSTLIKDYLKFKDTNKNPLTYMDNLIDSIKQKNISEIELIVEEMVNILAIGNPNKLSAELNTLQNIEVEPDFSKITLFASDTHLGKLCAEVVQKFLSKKKYKCNLQVIPGFSYKSLENFEKGLISFTNLLISNIESALVEKEEVLLIITGGFKAQIVYSAVIAMLYKIPLLYYNELFSDVICLPPLPLRLDKKFWTDFKDYLIWFQQPRAVEEIRQKMDSIPKELSFFLEEKGESKKVLSALGKILIKLYNSDFYTSYT